MASLDNPFYAFRVAGSTDSDWTLTEVTDGSFPESFEGLGNTQYEVKTKIWSDSAFITTEPVPIIEGTLYVRPSGSTYGTGDGSSYANAWSGFSSINWASLENNVLAVCGTHFQDQLNVQANNVTIVGNDPNESGVLDGEDVTGENLLVVGFTGITINNLTSTRATTSCFAFKAGSQGVTNDCTTTFSGNQGLQHLIDAEWTHNDLTSTDNVDDGVSLHEAAIVVLNNPTLSNNNQGVAHIGTSNVTINGGTFSTNTTDLKCGDIDIARPVMTINNVTVDVVDVRDGAIFTANNCTITALDVDSTGVSDCDSTYNDCIITVSSIGQNITTLVTNNCLVDTGIISPSGIFEFNRSYIINCEFIQTYAHTIKGRHSLFVSRISTTDMFRAGTAGRTYDLLYCSLVARFTNRKSLIATDVSSDTFTNLDNLTFYDVNNNARAMLTVGDLTIENCIFSNFDQAILNFTGNTLTANNCVFNGNTLDHNGDGTLTKVDDQSGTPNFTNVSIFDFSISPTSSAINNGKTLTDTTGIESAVWGNGTTETPVVTTKEQGVSWDIGAYIS